MRSKNMPKDNSDMRIHEFILKIEKLARDELQIPEDHQFSQDELYELRPMIQRIVNEHPEFGYKMEQVSQDRYKMIPIH
jgi:AraC-like DNA-binding protein